MMKPTEEQKFKRLLEKYAEGSCTPSEKELLEDMIFFNPLSGDWDWKSESEKETMKAKILDGIISRPSSRRSSSLYHWFMGVAAAILVVFILFMVFQKDNVQDALVKIKETGTDQPFMMSKSAVSLVLGEGEIFHFDDDATGLVYSEEGYLLQKTVNNEKVLVKLAEPLVVSKAFPTEPGMNTIHIPSGKDFEVRLQDGSVIWLNAFSSLTFPDGFKDKTEREVSLIGEAYFEIAHQRTKPFIVHAQNTRIEVTGTRFNISAYSTDENVITTLLEGGVNIEKENETLSLIPGYQAITSERSRGIESKLANIEHVMAWRNGYFFFDGKDFTTAMKDIARWYGVDITLKGEIGKQEIGGTFPKSAPLTQLLTDLERLTKLKFVEERKGVVVMP